MIKSMTGFASLTREDEQAVISVTVRAVNHRFLDVQARLPQGLLSIEPRLKTRVQNRIARGRIELSVLLQLRSAPTLEIEVNDRAIDALSRAFAGARERGLITGALTPSDLLRVPQAVTIRERQNETDAATMGPIFERVETTVDDALVELDKMRAHEGAILRADLDERRTIAADLVERIARAADAGRTRLETRLLDRARELQRDLSLAVDEAALAQEVVRTAARSDISEEVVRFRAHLAHWTTLMESCEPCGRKLDFLLQEMNREINTMGAKADGPGVSELIVAAKAELERLREQVQNVE